MAKKSKKIEKETRRLIEGMSELIKKKPDGYKLKSKSKKAAKKIKKTCVHWIMRKGKETPTVVNEGGNKWRCTVCNATFPVKPYDDQDRYDEIINTCLEVVNQMLFWSVKMGGDAEDTKMFIELKRDLPRLNKVAKQILKELDKRQQYENNRADSDSMSQFANYSGYMYR